MMAVSVEVLAERIVNLSNKVEELSKELQEIKERDSKRMGTFVWGILGIAGFVLLEPLKRAYEAFK